MYSLKVHVHVYTDPLVLLSKQVFQAISNHVLIVLHFHLTMSSSGAA
jgi:hypothetical protein